MAKRTPKERKCIECGEWVPSIEVITDGLAETLARADAFSPVGATHDAIWLALCILRSAVESDVAQLRGLCFRCSDVARRAAGAKAGVANG